MKRRLLLIALGVVGGLVLIVAAGMWFLSTQPMYTPGMVRQAQNLTAPLAPPDQPAGSGGWLVEPGITLAHFSQGEGRDVLVIHGGPGQPFAQPITGLAGLSTDYRFRYYAQRGCGDSTRPFDRFASSDTYANMQTLERSLGLGAQIADIERIRQLLGEDKLILIGHSWGGFLAALYAAEFPERVEALILVSPATVLVMPQPETGSDLFTSVRERLPAERQIAFDAFMDEYFDFGRLFTKSESELIALNGTFGGFYAEAVDTALPQQGRSGGWMVWAQYLSLGQRHDYRPALAAVDAPVLVLHGADDLQSEAASRAYADAFPNAEFAVIEDAGHFSFEQQPAQFGQVVAAFLAGLR